ncbi:hypothetical protein [Sphingomonas sp.]|uniref:hypothetical protein n=1 Tax=Sphingomonas sp. TaxID=28214 RepID=UPI002DD64F98|nr:hypothetical protein [Sphingomonas sp.]
MIEAVRAAAQAHARSWEALVPDPLTVDRSAEAAEEAAFAAMAVAKQRLHDHIRATYGVSVRDLANLALV